MEEKVFYRQETTEWLLTKDGDSELMSRHYSEVRYGVLPKESEETYDSYKGLLEAVKQRKEEEKPVSAPGIFNDLSVQKRFGKFGKEVIYSSSKGWVEEGMFGAGIIKEKTFDKYIIERIYIKEEPTIGELITSIPLKMVTEYLKDHPDQKKALEDIKHNIDFVLRGKK